MAQKQKKILPFGKAMIYGLGIFGIQLLIGYLNSYQTQFYSEVLHAKFTICAVIILVAKLISSLADPFIGNLIDRSNFKSGKMKPFVTMSALPFAIITTIMFVFIDFKGNNTLMYTYITVTTILWNIAMSFADIPSQGMLALITPNSDERNTAAGISNLMKTLGLAAPGLIVPIVCVLTKSPDGHIHKLQFLVTAVVVSVIALILYAVMIFGTKEVVKSPPNKMSFKAMFTEMKNNRNLVMIFLIYILGFGRNMAMGIGVQGAAVLFDKIQIGPITLAGDNLPLLMGVGSAIGSMVSVIGVPIINKKWGEKKTYLVLGVYGFVVSTLAYVLFVIGGPEVEVMGHVVPVFRCAYASVAYQFLIGFMFGTHGFTPMVMLADTVDYQEMKTGKRTEGIQYAVLSLGIKVSNALSVAGGIFLVGLSGYDKYNISEVYQAALQKPSIANIIMLPQWLIPGIAVALSCIPVLLYTIGPKEKAQIKEFMAKKELAESKKD